MMDIFHLKYQV